MDNLIYFESLLSLTINNCKSLNYIPNFTNLTKLRITNCSIYKLEKFPALQELYLENCNNIKIIHNYPVLKKLSINSLYNLKYIENLPNLTKLHMENCYKIKSLLSINKLTELVIYDSNITELPVMDELCTLVEHSMTHNDVDRLYEAITLGRRINQHLEHFSEISKDIHI